ncbi:MAG: prenyltransferase/squalene oxidase repeat-containing protein [Candidatus Marinimicrobia bacterium]|nr:prenyltransferase/squalene oxidase repeat-containing protein [Candidatus Neomarinimicrobiota bacterium]
MQIEHLVKKIQLLSWEERADKNIAPQKLPPEKLKIKDIQTDENLEWLNQLKVNPIQKLMDSKNSLVHYKLVTFIFRLLPADPLYKSSLENLKNDFHRVGNLKTLDEINYEISNIPDNKMSIYQLITLIKTLSELYDYFCHNRMNTIKKSFYYIFKQQESDGSFPYNFYLNVYIIELILKYNYEHNQFAEKAIRWLIRQQNSDGGWGNANGKSDIWITLKVLNACSYHSIMQNRKKIFKGADFILNNYLDQNSGGVVSGKEIWNKFSNKHFNKDSFKGGILKILEVFNRLGYTKENEKLNKFLNIINEKQREDGYWYDDDIETQYHRELITGKVIEIFHNYYSTHKKIVKRYKIKSGGRTSAKKPIFLQEQSDTETEPTKDLSKKEE